MTRRFVVSGKAGVKAGLIGIAVMVVLTLLNQFVIPIRGALTYVMCGVSTLLYVGIGTLAGYFLAPPRTPGKGAGAGAIAGLISGVVSTIIGSIIMFTRFSMTGEIPGVTPDQMQQLADSGMEPKTLLILGMTVGPVCSMAIGAGAAAIGGAILGALKTD
jgi:hypothetical protein